MEPQLLTAWRTREKEHLAFTAVRGQFDDCTRALTCVRLCHTHILTHTHIHHPSVVCVSLQDVTLISQQMPRLLCCRRHLICSLVIFFFIYKICKTLFKCRRINLLYRHLTSSLENRLICNEKLFKLLNVPHMFLLFKKAGVEHKQYVSLQLHLAYCRGK